MCLFVNTWIGRGQQIQITTNLHFYPHLCVQHFHIFPLFCPALCCVSAHSAWVPLDKQISFGVHSGLRAYYDTMVWAAGPCYMQANETFTYYYRKHHWALLVLINILLLLCHFWFLSWILHSTCKKKKRKKASWVTCKKQWETVMYEFSKFQRASISFCLMPSKPSLELIVCAIIKCMWTFWYTLFGVFHAACLEKSVMKY